jgi:hypothetical protein
LKFYNAYKNVINENKVTGLHLLQICSSEFTTNERAEITENSAIQGVSSIQYERKTFSTPVQGVG